MMVFCITSFVEGSHLPFAVVGRGFLVPDGTILNNNNTALCVQFLWAREVATAKKEGCQRVFCANKNCRKKRPKETPLKIAAPPPKSSFCSAGAAGLPHTVGLKIHLQRSLKVVVTEAIPLAMTCAQPDRCNGKV